MSTLGVWYPLQFFGPAASAAVIESSAAVAGGIKGTASPGATIAGSSSVPQAHVTGLKNSPALITASGAVVDASPLARARLTCTVSIGSRPSATDVAEAVVAQKVHGLGPGTISIGDALALLTRILRNRAVTDPSAGTLTIFDDADAAPALVADLWADADGTAPYAGSGADRRDRLE